MWAKFGIEAEDYNVAIDKYRLNEDEEVMKGQDQLAEYVKDFEDLDDNPQDVNQSQDDFYADSDQEEIASNGNNERNDNMITEFLIQDE